MRRTLGIASLIIAILLIVYGAYLFFYLRGSGGDEPSAAYAVPAILTQPLPAGTPEAVVRGRYLTIAGDCAACHTPEGKPAFSGGLALITPFGKLYSANITPDHDSGIGSWSADQFWRAMHEGVRANGAHLYPAFPYPNFTAVSRRDSDAIYAYLRTVPAVHVAVPRNTLPFPLNIRALMIGWNALFFRPHGIAYDTRQSVDWNRGRYIVETLGHCTTCHSPKNLFEADKQGQAYQGNKLDDWVAPNLTSDARVGLGQWSQADIVTFLKTGRNAHANAGGTMAEVITDSTSLMADSDLAAIASYLKSLPAAGAPEAAAAADPVRMRAGQAIFEDVCAACHRIGGQGVPGFFPSLGGLPNVNFADPNNMIRAILEGARTASTPTRPSALTMPSYAWQLNDQQIADFATYVRQSWGNHGAAVDASTVRKLRGRLDLATSRPSSWSGQ